MPYRNGQIVRWKTKIKGIRPLLTEDDSDENAQKVGKEIYKIVTSSLYKKYFKIYEDDMLEPLDSFLFVEDCEHLNSLLSTLYDYCDANLIWIDFD